MPYRHPLPPTTLLVVVLAACGGPRFTEPQVLGGVTVSAEVLAQGQDLYELKCFSCHGYEGDGAGPAADGLEPPPRNFQQGFFKFASTVDPEDSGNSLPTDEDLVRLIRRGLDGTAMLPWDASDDEALAVVQYIKTFSDRWRSYRPGDVYPIAPDPWGVGRRAEAVSEGARIYHGVARCWACHPAYLEHDRFWELTGTSPIHPPRDDYRRPALKDGGDRRVLTVGALQPVWARSTDFLTMDTRSIDGPRDVYRLVGTGVGGAAMAAFPFTSEEQWALAWYTWDLIRMKNTAEGRSLLETLRSQPPWTPPTPVGEPEDVR